MTKKEAIVIAAERGLNHSHTLIFYILAGFSGNDDMCAVSHKTIAQQAKMSISTIKSCLAALEKAGHIGIIRSNCDVSTFILLREIGGAAPVSSPYGRYTYEVRHGSGHALIANDRQLNSLKKRAVSYKKTC